MAKSEALSKEVTKVLGSAATSILGVRVMGADSGMGMGFVEAKRNAVPFRIERFVRENGDLAYILEFGAPWLERSGLDLMGAFRKLTDENW